MGKHIGKRMNLRCLDDVHPLPISFKDILPEELQAVPVNLNDAPGMRINQLGKIAFQLFDGQLIRAAIKVIWDPSYSSCIAIDSLIAHASKLQRSKVTIIQFIKSRLFCSSHFKLQIYRTRH